MRRLTRAATIVLCCLALPLAGCAPAAIGGATTAGTAAAQERGLSGALKDTEIRTQINHLWFQADERMYRKVSLQVQNRRVLITGIVDEPELRRKAARLSWQADDVREVINEVEVSDEGGVGTYAKDTWISSQLKSKILFDSDIKSINYSIETVNKKIYLLGVARSRKELDLVLNHARNIANVKEVVSYVEVMKGKDKTATEETEA